MRVVVIALISTVLPTRAVVSIVIIAVVAITEIALLVFALLVFRRYTFNGFTAFGCNGTFNSADFAFIIGIDL